MLNLKNESTYKSLRVEKEAKSILVMSEVAGKNKFINSICKSTPKKVKVVYAG